MYKILMAIILISPICNASVIPGEIAMQTCGNAVIEHIDIAAMENLSLVKNQKKCFKSPTGDLFCPMAYCFLAEKDILFCTKQ
jgi:hypothetical protein